MSVLPKNLPRGWSGMGYCAKAGWLTAGHYARSYEDACSMLTKGCRKKVKKMEIVQKNLWYLQD